MNPPTSWDDRSPLEYQHFREKLEALHWQRSRRGDTSWKSRIGADLRKDASAKKAIETWLSQAFAKLVEGPTPRLELSKGPWKEADFAVFVEFYNLLFTSSDDTTWQGEAFLNKVRRDRGLHHGIRNDGASDPQVWGRNVARIPTAMSFSEDRSPTPVASTSRPAKRKSPEDADETKKNASGKVKEVTPPAKKRKGRPSRASGPKKAKQAKRTEETEEGDDDNTNDATGDTDADGEPDGEEKPVEAAVERPAKKRKASAADSEISALTDASDAGKDAANGARGSKEESEPMEDQPEGEEELTPSTKPKAQSKGKAAPKAAAKKPPAKRGRKSKVAAKDQPLGEEEESSAPPAEEAPAEEDKPLSAKPAPSKGRKAARGKGRASAASRSEPADDAMDVDKPAEDTTVPQGAKAGDENATLPTEDFTVAVEAASDAPPPTTDGGDPPSSPLTDDFTPPPESHFQESDLRSAPAPKSSAKGKKAAPRSKASVQKEKETQRAPAESAPTSTKPPPSKAKPASKATSKAAADKTPAPVSQVKAQEKKTTTEAPASKSAAKTAKPSAPKPQLLNALAMDYGSDDDEPARAISLSPPPFELSAPSKLPQQSIDDTPTTQSPTSSGKPNGDSSSPVSSPPKGETNGTPEVESKGRRSGRRNKQNDSGLAGVYNNVFNANASLNKQATEKGQELRFNSEAGSAQ